MRVTARVWYRLPYFRAAMAMMRVEGWIRYTSRRTHCGAAPAELVARYRARGAPIVSTPDSLDAWLTERYRLYVADGRGAVGADIDHAPWSLRRGAAEVDTMTEPHGLRLPDTAPLLHVAEHSGREDRAAAAARAALARTLEEVAPAGKAALRSRTTIVNGKS